MDHPLAFGRRVAVVALPQRPADVHVKDAVVGAGAHRQQAFVTCPGDLYLRAELGALLEIALVCPHPGDVIDRLSSAQIIAARNRTGIGFSSQSHQQLKVPAKLANLTAVVLQSRIQMLRREIGPEDIQGQQFGIGHLPHHEVADAVRSTTTDEKVRVEHRARVQWRAKVTSSIVLMCSAPTSLTVWRSSPRVDNTPCLRVYWNRFQCSHADHVQAEHIFSVMYWNRFQSTPSVVRARPLEEGRIAIQQTQLEQLSNNFYLLML